MEFIQIKVDVRDDMGTLNARRLRREGQVPAVLYGMKRSNMQLAIPEKELSRFLNTGSHLVELRLGDETRPAILREVQYDQVTDQILHVDFHRIDHDHEVEDHVRVNFKGRARGEGEGGVFQALRETVQVRCRPKHLPEDFLLEIADLGIGDSLRVSDLTVPENVEVLDDDEEIIAQVALPKRQATTTEDEEAEAAEAAEGEADGTSAEGGDASASDAS